MTGIRLNNQFCCDCKFRTVLEYNGFYRLGCAVTGETHLPMICSLSKSVLEFYLFNYVVEQGKLKFIGGCSSLG